MAGRFVCYAHAHNNTFIRLYVQAMNVWTNIGQPIFGSLKGNFLEYLIPGMLVTLSFFLALSLTALSFVTDKKDGNNNYFIAVHKFFEKF
uniref:Uncharacterized protein n=1 Tax=Strigamia maritima TaxID=126957 RepID=T1J8M3_STRMM